MPDLDTQAVARQVGTDSRARTASWLPALIEGMRPKQWAKNAFVLAPLFFAGKTTDASAWGRTALAVAAFCLASGATYLINDVVDVDIDRRNPRTTSRPIARGALSIPAAIAASGIAAAASLGIAAAINWRTLLVVAGFLALQLAYSYALKSLLFVDVLAIAAGFVLRAVGGGVAMHVRISSWLLLSTGLLAVFLGLTKRRAEAVAVSHGLEGRALLRNESGIDHYSVRLVDELIAVVTPGTLVVYAIYTVTAAPSEAMLLTLPFVLYGIFRVLLLIHHAPADTEDPTALAWRDRPLLICTVLWAITVAAIAVSTR